MVKVTKKVKDGNLVKITGTFSIVVPARNFPPWWRPDDKEQRKCENAADVARFFKETDSLQEILCELDERSLDWSIDVDDVE